MRSAIHQVEQANSQIRAKSIDEMMDSYVDWREQCNALAETYERWSNGSIANRKLAFEAYKAALDLEEHASLIYAERVNRLGDQLTSRFRRLTLGRGN
jgi:hypothetical protein